MSEIIIMPPEAEIVKLDNFDLKQIEDFFQYASFERPVSRNKVTTIARAIMENKFADNVLRCVETDDDAKYDVIDGQHRVEALRYARDNFNLDKYNMVLFVYRGQNAREIYRRLNLGRPLNLSDHLKALDTGEVEFFNKLRTVCDHQRQAGMIKYSTMINNLKYAKGTLIHPVKPLEVDTFVTSISEHDIEYMKSFVPIVQQIATSPNNPFYRYTIMRNFFRVYYENVLTPDKMIELGALIMKSKKIKDLIDERDIFVMRGIYHEIIDIGIKKLGLKLMRGLVKN